MHSLTSADAGNKNHNDGAVALTHMLFALQHCAIFRDLPEATLKHFEERSALETYPAKTMLFFQDEPAAWCYLITEGLIKLVRHTNEGEETVLQIIGAGELVAAESIYTDHKYGYSCQTTAPSQLIKIPTALLEYYITKHPELATNLLKDLARSQSRKDQEIEQLTVQSTAQRLACFLIRLIDPIDGQNGHEAHLPYDKTLIAARLGMKAETFSRALARLKRDTAIDIDGADVKIPDVGKLIAYTCPACSKSTKRLESL